MDIYSRDKSVSILGRLQFKGGGWDSGSIPSVDYRKIGKLKRSISGFKNPHWKEQIENLENATTDATGYYLDLGINDGKHWIVNKDNLGNLRRFEAKGSWPSYLCMDQLSLNGPDLWPTTVDTLVAANRATIRFRKNLRAAQVAFSSGVFLGELKETIGMIRHPAKGLSDLARAYFNRVKDAKKKSPRNWKGNLSSLWLEQAFGWQPLIADINDAYKAYQNLHKVKTRFVSGFGKNSILRPTNPNPASSTLLMGGGQLGQNIFMVMTEHAIVKFRACIKREIQAPVVDDLNHFGFKASEFLPTAWELLPWSFLIDYFVNIGDVIEANTISTAPIAWISRSDVVVKDYFGTATPFSKSQYAGLTNPQSLGGDGSTARLTSRKWTRSANASIGFGYPEFKIPGIWAPWANMTALFAQANAELSPQRRWHR